MKGHGTLCGIIALALTGCIADDGENDEIVDVNRNGLITTPDGSFVALFLDASTMRGSTSDWDWCRGKASCAPGEAVTGISRVVNGPGRAALCSPRGSSYSGTVGALLTLDGNKDNRQAVRQVNGNADWAYGYYKLECAAGQYVQGVSENANQCQSNNRFHAIRCAKGQGLVDSGCSTRVFDQGDARGNTASGDWDFGAFKGECRDSEYLAGVSVNPVDGHPHSLLCCPSQASAAPYYGISPDHGTFDSGQAGTLRALGADMVRLQLCDWPASKQHFQHLVDTARAEGLEVHAEINYCTLPAYSTSASWHAGFTDAPGQQNAFAKAFVKAAGEIAAAYAGKIYVYEIWNEPNASPRPVGFPNPFWPDAQNADWDGTCGAYAYGADYNQSAWALCARQLGVVTAGAYGAIAAADPSAGIVAGNLFHHGADGWVAREYYKELDKSPAVQRFVQQHNRRPWDFMGYHPYGQRPGDGSLAAQLTSFRNAQNGRGDPSPIAITEYGWSTQGGDPNYLTDEAGQAAMLPAAFEVARQHGVAFFTWFNYLDASGLSMGLRRSNMSWKPAAKAFCQATGAAACPAN
jgi:hypothetical protein